MKTAKEILKDEGIEEYGIIDFSKLTVINPRLLPKGEKICSALIILMPYRRGNVVIKDNCNMGLFARIPDYHGYFRGLAERIAPLLEEAYGSKVFAYADHSPIHEKEGAQKCGLGFIGKNSLLINPVYGSFVFIGCFLFTKHLEEIIRTCNKCCGSCRLCTEECPTSAVKNGSICTDKCLSALSQKKQKTPEERALLSSTKTVWGCDICQNICPYNKKAKPSPIEGFSVNVLENVTPQLIETMDENTYYNYAFSYREKRVIAENFLTDRD